MEDMFIVTEAKSNSAVRTEELVRVYRSRWELENRAAALEAEVRDQTSLARDLRARLATLDYQQRELLKGISKILVDCDDTLHVESSRLRGAHPDDPAVRQSRKWNRRVERIRANLAACLTSHGVSMHSPDGVPNPDLDTIHSALQTDAVTPGEIVEVLRPGMLWNGSLLRYSLVVVAATLDIPDE